MLSNYRIDSNGVIQQTNILTIQYDHDYVEQRYNSYPTGKSMAHLRLGYLLGVLKEFKPKSILDVGYGNGDFLEVASKFIEDCSGFDIPPAYPLSDNIKTIQNMYTDTYDVVCFFDSLEHFHNIYEIKKLKTKYVYISLPWCHNFSNDWFENWKHRRPNEHIWHFDLNSLKSFFLSLGYEYITHSAVEDIIRQPEEKGVPNILTAIFQYKS